MNRNYEMEDLEFIPFQYPVMSPMMTYKTGLLKIDPMKVQLIIEPKMEPVKLQFDIQPIKQPIMTQQSMSENMLPCPMPYNMMMNTMVMKYHHMMMMMMMNSMAMKHPCHKRMEPMEME